MSVTLQVSVAPSDVSYLERVLSHQLRQVGEQVDEILIVADTVKGHGRYVSNWEYGMGCLDEILRKMERTNENVRIAYVDYSADAVEQVATALDLPRFVPPKDSHGAPFYAYLYGVLQARSQYVLHCDSDMLFGGGARGWVMQAVALLRSEPEVLFTGPFPGPPRPNLRLSPQAEATAHLAQRYGSIPTLHPTRADCLSFGHMSTRSFMVDIERLKVAMDGCLIELPAAGRLNQRAVGPSPLEVCLSGLMRRRGFHRTDMLGSGSGMWVLHPPFKNGVFLRHLAALISAVESGEIPQEQRGEFDVQGCMFPRRYEPRFPFLRRQAARCSRCATALRRYIRDEV